MGMSAERVARNDAIFRDANEAIERAAVGASLELVPFVCECADEGCTRIVPVRLADYEDVRADSRRFLVLPGHEQGAQDFARVVAGGDGYVVVEKLGEAADIVEQLDSRAAESAEDARARRIGLNEAVFRGVNEELEQLGRRFRRGEGPLELVCECANLRCHERIRVPREAYERVRSDSRLFAVMPGHEEDAVEEIVERAGGYDVVRKRGGTPTDVARATDSRRSSRTTGDSP
jgi:hypothetical protein